MKYALILILLGHFYNAHAAPIPTPATCTVEKPAGTWPSGVKYWARWYEGVQYRIGPNAAGWAVYQVGRGINYTWAYGPSNPKVAAAKMTNCDVVRLVNLFKVRLAAGDPAIRLPPTRVF